ncbi:anaphase-promoting complex subunit cdc27 [Blastocladiella emersonii ATCC 22665]|nr:anaphase-promoting complex subunit cdc27 [Blastocladiella emersonii ATCC 22665]
MTLGTHLALAIQSALDHLDFATAHFLADRLVAFFPLRPDARYWLARTLFHQNRPAAAALALRDFIGVSAACRFLYARACVAAGQLHDAEAALVARVDAKTGAVVLRPVKGVKGNGVSFVQPPAPAAVWTLLGDIYRRTERPAVAAHCHARAVAGSPFQWTSFTAVCELGAATSAASLIKSAFTVDAASAALKLVRDARPCGILALAPAPPTPAPAPLTESAPAPAPAATGTPKRKRTASDAGLDLARVTRSQSKRLATTAALESSPKPASAPAPPSKKASLEATSGLAPLLSHLTTLASAVRALAQCKPSSARHHLLSLPATHQASGWVQRHLARACMLDRRDHAARDHFARARKVEPWSVSEGADYYSTALWLLGSKAELEVLAAEVSRVAPGAREVGVVQGNLASLQGKHEAAVAAFVRAGEVDQAYAYARVMLGHEYLAMDRLDAAATAFRKAVALDPNSYNAWNGLGLVYEREGNHAAAQDHYVRAAKINASATMYLSVGNSLLAQSKWRDALGVFQHALKLDAANPACKAGAVKAHLYLDDVESALPLLTDLRTAHPGELTFHYLAAYAYDARGDRDACLQSLNDAAACAPPSGVPAAAVRECMARLARGQGMPTLDEVVSGDPAEMPQFVESPIV